VREEFAAELAQGDARWPIALLLSDFVYGDTVQLCGLKAQPELNGKTARVGKQPASIQAKERLRVALCTPHGGPLPVGTKHQFINALASNMLKHTREGEPPAPPTVEPLLGSSPQPDRLELLSDDHLVCIMMHLSRAERLNLASAHPHFRRVLFCCPELWAGVLKLELQNSREEGGGWYAGASCICCGVSFLDAKLLPCGSCQTNFFCKRCLDYEHRPSCMFSSYPATFCAGELLLPCNLGNAYSGMPPRADKDQWCHLYLSHHRCSHC
jgi:hypothetical protein